jgi:hypothetical protein
MCLKEMATPECLSASLSLTEKLWGGGQHKRITLMEKTDIIYAIRIWDEGRKRWIFMEMQKLKPSHFVVEGAPSINLVCKRYVRYCVYTSTAEAPRFSFQGGDILRLLTDSRHKPTDMDIYMWEALLNGFLMRGSIPTNWKSSDMEYVRNLLK